MNFLVFVLFLSSFIGVCSGQNIEQEQLYQIDKGYFFDTLKKQTIYPNLKLRIGNDGNIFLDDYVVFNKKLLTDRYCCHSVTVFNKEFFVVSVLDSMDLALSVPEMRKTKKVYLFHLDQPHKLFSVDFDEKEIVRTNDLFDIYKKNGDSKYMIESINFKKKSIVLIETTNRRLKYKIKNVD